MIRSVPDPLDPSLLEEAARWRIAIAEGVRSQSDFRQWIESDPDRRAAADAVNAGWAPFDDVEAGMLADDIRVRLGRRRQTAGRGIIATAAAASLVLAVAAPWQGRADAYSTGIGHSRVVVLSDGSRIQLDGNSAIRVSLRDGRRDIWLDRGQAQFDVAPERRPFAVHAGGRTVAAEGTSFDVELINARTIVTLMRGRLSVSRDDLANRARAALAIAPDDAIALSSGQQLVGDGGATTRVLQPDIGNVGAWRTGRLIMADMQLGDAIARINRQSSSQIVLADTSLAALRLSGVLSLRDAKGFAEIVASHLALSVAHSPNGTIVLSRS